MAGQLSKKRTAEEFLKGRKPKRPVKKFKKQTDYHSDSSDEGKPDFNAASPQDFDEDGDEQREAFSRLIDVREDEDVATPLDPYSGVTDASDSDSDSISEEESDLDSNPNLIRKRKRNDPEAFATSISKILGSKLSTTKRSDPVLSRSITALQASKEMTDQALEKKAKYKLWEERRVAMDKGRVKDVLGVSTAFDAARGEDSGGTATSAETMELEKRLRKTAQRGVMKLFNAVRAAQIKGEEAARDARKKGLVGHGRREEKVNEMTKQGFLELIAGGGGGLKSGGIEEA